MGAVLLNEARRVLVPAAAHDEEMNCMSARAVAQGRWWAHRRGGGGRTWWAHARFTSINIGLTILRNQVEEFSQLDVGRSCFDEAEISPSRPRELCVQRASHMRFTSSPP